MENSVSDSTRVLTSAFCDVTLLSVSQHGGRSRAGELLCCVKHRVDSGAHV